MQIVCVLDCVCVSELSCYPYIVNVKKQPGPIHETHHQYGNKQRFTPIELSRMKAEKDLEIVMAQRRQEEQRRQMRLQMVDNSIAQRHALNQMNPAIARSAQVNISQQQQQRLSTQIGATTPLSPQAMQQARALAQAQAHAQAQAAQSQQAAHPQVQNQVTNVPIGMGGAAHLAAQFASRGGATSPVAQLSSPPRSSGTPSNAPTNFPRPSSAQRNVAIPGTTGLPIGAGQVTIPGNPIARQSNSVAAYIANAQFSPEHMEMIRYQIAVSICRFVQFRQWSDLSHS